MKTLSNYGQYKHDIFTKLGFGFQPGRKILDVGCGDGSDDEILRDYYRLNVEAIDVYKHQEIDRRGISFRQAGIYQIPFPDETFDYVFLHDILHHIDEGEQRYQKHLAGLRELRRVLRTDGYLIIIEGNRYNPIFYPHMVKALGHDHFRQKYFKKIILDVFPEAKLNFFECHLYPRRLVRIFKIYEKIMETISPSTFLSYNVAIAKKNAK